MVLDQNQRRSILERAQVEIAQDINELQIQQVKMQQIVFKVNEQDMDGIELQEDVEEIMSGKDPSKVRPKAQLPTKNEPLANFAPAAQMQQL